MSAPHSLPLPRGGSSRCFGNAFEIAAAAASRSLRLCVYLKEKNIHARRREKKKRARLHAPKGSGMRVVIPWAARPRATLSLPSDETKEKKNKPAVELELELARFSLFHFTSVLLQTISRRSTILQWNVIKKGKKIPTRLARRCLSIETRYALPGRQSLGIESEPLTFSEESVGGF